MTNDDVKSTKSRDFAVRIALLRKYLVKNGESVMSLQLVRSGTSIGANIAEANCSESSKDFIHKIKIALKEANETEYWLDVLYRAGHLTERQFKSIHGDCVEILKILTSIIQTNKNRN